MAASDLSTTLSPDVLALAQETVDLRRDLHRHPELGFAETRTAGLVAAGLEAAGLEVRSGIARTGVVGLLRGAHPGKTLLVRADMDALSLTEEVDTPWKSTVPGSMHACGHDGHVAIALTAARVLAARRDRLKGQVKFVFQPAEEGPGGAEPMIAEGVLRDPPVDAAIGLHIWNSLEAGTLGIGSGAMMAASDEFRIVVEGVGGHGAYPHTAIDPVLAAAHIVVALQSIVARNVSPLEPAVVTVGIVRAGTRFNIIPRTAELVGTLRAYTTETREFLIRRTSEIARGVAEAHGAKIHVHIERGYPPTVNDQAMSAFCSEVAAGVFGRERVVVPERSMGGEDMSYFLNQVPGCFMFLGSANKAKGLDAPHHSPLFDFDEDVMPLGVETFVRVAEAYLL